MFSLLTLRNLIKRKAKANPRLEPSDWNTVIEHDFNPSQIARNIILNRVNSWVTPIMENTKPDDKVLELGSGTGELSVLLAKENRLPTLLDFSAKNLRFSECVFRQAGLRGDYILGNVLDVLPFRNEQFDCVWSSGLLEHFSDDEIVFILKESKRVSKCIVLCLVPNANSVMYRFGKWYQETMGTWPFGFEIPKYSMKYYFGEASIRNVREYSIDPYAALGFVTMKNAAGIRKLMQEWYESIPSEDLMQMNQGYLLVTVGEKI